MASWSWSEGSEEGGGALEEEKKKLESSLFKLVQFGSVTGKFSKLNICKKINTKITPVRLKLQDKNVHHICVLSKSSAMKSTTPAFQ